MNNEIKLEFLSKILKQKESLIQSGLYLNKMLIAMHRADIKKSFDFLMKAENCLKEDCFNIEIVEYYTERYLDLSSISKKEFIAEINDFILFFNYLNSILNDLYKKMYYINGLSIEKKLSKECCKKHLSELLFLFENLLINNIKSKKMIYNIVFSPCFSGMVFKICDLFYINKDYYDPDCDYDDDYMAFISKLKDIISELN